MSSSILIVTLQATGLDDLELPAKNIQVRRRDGQPTYAQAVIPDATTYKDLASPYQDGTLLIEAGEVDNYGNRSLSELVQVDFEKLVEDTGVRDSSLSLSGYKDWTSGSSQEIELKGVSVYSLQANGKRRIRCPVNASLRPGDTATFSPGQGLASESMTAGQIAINADTRNQRMDVTEA